MSTRTVLLLTALGMALIVVLLAIPDRQREPVIAQVDRSLSVDSLPSPPELRVPSAKTRPASSARPIANPVVRVAVSERAREVSLQVAAPFKLVQVGTTKSLSSAKSQSKTTVTVTARGIRIGTREWAVSGVEIIPETSPAIWIGDTLYRGRVRLHKVGDRVLAVNVLPMEDYVPSVVDSEMPSTFPLEARKAQAILARTFALYQRDATSSSALHELVSGVKSQKYLGYQYRSGGRLLAGETSAGRQAALETRGLVCTYSGSPFCTYYCAVCGGSTINGRLIFDDAAPPLVSVPCDFCREARLYRWNVTLAKADVLADLQKRLTSQGNSIGRIKSFTPAKSRTGPPGGLPDFELRGEKRTLRLSGFDVRLALLSRGLPGPRFTLAERGSNYVFTGQGHGHGAGLCQWGACGMAKEGRTARQIVEHYYTGAKVQPWVE